VFYESICAYVYVKRPFYVNASRYRAELVSDFFARCILPLSRARLRQTFADAEDQEFYATFFMDAFRFPWCAGVRSAEAGRRSSSGWSSARCCISREHERM
jgi:hypothetical protein